MKQFGPGRLCSILLGGLLLAPLAVFASDEAVKQKAEKVEQAAAKDSGQEKPGTTEEPADKAAEPVTDPSFNTLEDIYCGQAVALVRPEGPDNVRQASTVRWHVVR